MLRPALENYTVSSGEGGREVGKKEEEKEKEEGEEVKRWMKKRRGGEGERN